jgi:hypothetical protein
LEELVLKIGYDPSNVKAAEEMIKKKNADITSLRKQLKLAPIEDSQAKERKMKCSSCSWSRTHNLRKWKLKWRRY